MIANEIAFGKSFQANIHYNLYGNKSEPNPHKCTWHVSKNMFTDDMDAVGKVMEATASKSRAGKPVYHFSIDWDRSEEAQLNQGSCIEAADKVLAKIGLAEHQALYFWHVDANHPHMHVVVNRVHDETGKAWDMWKSKEKLERATHDIAQEMGFLQVPGKHNDMEYQPDKNKEANRSKSERATSEDLKPWSKEQLPDIKAEIGNAFYHSESWQELADTLSDAGYELRAKGQGLIVTDGTNYTQLSKIGKHVRLKALEDKFGESFTEHTKGNALEPVTKERFEQHHIKYELEELHQEVDRELKLQVKRAEKRQLSNPHTKHRGYTDPRVTELNVLLDAIDRFNGLWDQNKSATAMMVANKKVHQQHSLFKKAKNLLEFHEQASFEFIFKSYEKPKEDKPHTIVEKLDDALKDMNKYKRKSRKTKRLIEMLRWRKKKIAKEQERAKRHRKKCVRKLKAKNKQQFERKYYYRLQKIRDASDRLTKRGLELKGAQTRLHQSVKTHKHNVAVRKYLNVRRLNLIRNMPKEAIMNADVSWDEKKRLLAAWRSETHLQETREHSANRSTILEIDAFDS